MDRTTEQWLELRPDLKRLCKEGHSLNYIARLYEVAPPVMGQVLTAFGLETYGHRMMRELRERGQK